MTDSAARDQRRGRILALIGILLFAFSLRSAVASLSPVLGQVEADFAIPAWVVGLIGTAPPVCFAVFGLLAPQFERRLGLERLALLSIAVVAAGLVSRAFASSATELLLATIVIFAGVGTGNILSPPLVKKYFPRRIGLLTTLYTATMSVSTFLPPLFAVPLADAAGWRLSLGLWAVFAVIGMFPWLALLLSERRTRAGTAPVTGEIELPSPRVFGRMWSLPLAWAMAITFMSSSALAYTCFGFLPAMLGDLAGVNPATAGVLLSLFAAMGLLAALVVPALVVRYRALPALFVVAIVTGLAGIAGLLFAPTTVPWLWVALIGTAPLYFPLVLVLIGLRTRTHEGAIALSGFTQSIGYGIAACVPLAVGITHETSGSWTPALFLLAMVVAATIPAGFVLARPRMLEDEWERRHGAW